MDGWMDGYSSASSWHGILLSCLIDYIQNWKLNKSELKIIYLQSKIKKKQKHIYPSFSVLMLASDIELVGYMYFDFILLFRGIKMAAISQTIFADEFSRMKSFVFWLKFHWNMFMGVLLKITQRWFRWWLGAE